MRCQVMLTLDTDDGAYEIEFHRLDEKGGSMDYATLMEAVRRVFGDLDSRITNSSEVVARSATRQPPRMGGDGAEDIHLFGDDPHLS